jgi:translation initiation factor 1
MIEEMNKSKKKQWKQREGIIYSTDPQYSYTYNNEEEEDTLPPAQQLLYVSIDRKQRKGKTVTLISGFVGKGEDRVDLARLLKSKCGTGGTVKDQAILIQGDFREKVIQVLNDNGYRTKRSGG